MNHQDTKGTKQFKKKDWMQEMVFDPSRVAGPGGGPGQAVDQLAHRVIGAAIEVHRALGPGYLESVYESALAVELERQAIPFERQCVFNIEYAGQPVGEGRIDLLVDRRLVVELKAADALLPIHQAQAMSYLKALNLRLALLVNFNVPILKQGIKRIVL